MKKFLKIFFEILNYIWIGLIIYMFLLILYSIIMAGKSIETPYIPLWLKIGIMLLYMPIIFYRNKLKKEKKGEK